MKIGMRRGAAPKVQGSQIASCDYLQCCQLPLDWMEHHMHSTWESVYNIVKGGQHLEYQSLIVTP